jgi:signal transduction histidine kinase
MTFYIPIFKPLSMLRRYLNWNYLLVLLALLIAASAIFFANRLTRSLAEEEKKKVDVIQQALEIVATEEENIPVVVYTILNSNETIPLIQTDARDSIINFNNIDTTGQAGEAHLQKQLQILKAMHPPVEIRISDTERQLVYYGESKLLKQLRYFPFVLLVILFLFLLLVVFYISSSNRQLQDRVWVGMSKETAHQLGTPLTSLVAWIEYLKDTGVEKAALQEMLKDVERLQLIADRFSKIGSNPKLEEEDLLLRLRSIMVYMEKRASRQVRFRLECEKSGVLVLVSGPLFDWVIENLIRNSLDAMDGKGEILIRVKDEVTQTMIDVSDTGKGIAPANIKKVFHPGFSTKKRGWGLGLSLARRIIQEYHHGEIFVKRSEQGKGTTFRIILRR